MAVIKTLTLLPEWAHQEAVILAWPNEQTDWVDNLLDVTECYLALIQAINDSEATVILLCPLNYIGLAKSKISYHSRVLIVPCEYNDTWVRDYAFLTVSDNLAQYPVNFRFNGWGDKFEAKLDDQANQVLAKLCQQNMLQNDIVLEGGALEIDENQHLISTQSCLFNPKRNGEISSDEYNEIFQSLLGAYQTTMFENGHLKGDDTDGHIDTLVRFTPLMGIVMQSAFNRVDDEHYRSLELLKHEIKQAFPLHALYELPLPYVCDQYNNRLPASYANFLILNRRILFPIYQQPEDKQALEVIQKAFPNYSIIAINCLPLVQQFGSLHCITMQVPENTLKSEFIEQAHSGVSIAEV